MPPAAEPLPTEGSLLWACWAGTAICLAHAWSQGWQTVPPFPSLPWEPAWVAHWERVPLVVAPEPGVAIGSLHRARLVRAAGHWRPHKGIVCRGKRGFCLLLETGQREEQFPPFITNSPI